MTPDAGPTEPNPRAGGGPVEGDVASSYEARWFFDGEVPGPVVRAFLAEGDAGRLGFESVDGEGAGTDDPWPRPRTDRYLSFAADMGIKVRAEPEKPARIEFKGRRSLEGSIVFAPGVVGVASTWIKWSYPAAEVPAELRRGWAETRDEAPEGGSSAVAVVKRRLLRQFRLDEGAPAREVRLEERLPRGVQIELTRLRLHSGRHRRDADGGKAPGRTAWTVGFEGFPLGPGLPEAVRAAVSTPLRRLAAAGAELDRAHSASYPEWLTR